MLHLWGRLNSINVRKVVWAAQELGLPLQRTDAGGQHGIVCEPHFLERNPNGLVPLLEDGDVRLWESNVIVRYLCARYAPGTLCPEALGPRFVAEQWMDWQQTTFNPAVRPAFMQLVRVPADQRQPALIEQSIHAVMPLLDLLDQHLAQHAYLGGAEFTMADIPVGCEIHRWRQLPVEQPPRPNLERWYAALSARQGAKGVLTFVCT
jgi:glutathione S-transferase